jgi:hypothetical protein
MPFASISPGYEPMAEPLPELFVLEPEDVHLRKGSDRGSRPSVIIPAG